jgi:hypothetical protein
MKGNKRIETGDACLLEEFFFKKYSEVKIV